ncbi:MAG: hypothetical protein LBI72_00075 [Flavobacteriaceae bacterium]|jgi:hypothetical protein|nr:hypothetical protein [Flavobacteriaceae bacterium]
MSRIAIVLKDNHIDNTVLFKVKKVIGDALQDIKQRVEINEPLYSGVLFYNDHEDIVVQLKEVIDILEKENISYLIYELDEVLTDREDNQIISREVLERIVDWQSR